MAAAVAFHRRDWYCTVRGAALRVWRRVEGRAEEANVRRDAVRRGCWRRALRARAVARIVKRMDQRETLKGVCVAVLMVMALQFFGHFPVLIQIGASGSDWMDLLAGQQ